MPENSSHTRIPRAPVQTKFAARRTSKRHETRDSLPLLREQSTLTQIDFVTSSSHDSRDSDEDEVYVEMPPKKRRRTYERGRPMKQTTVTQNWRDFVRPDDPQSSDENYQYLVNDSDDRAKADQQQAWSRGTASSETNDNSYTTGGRRMGLVSTDRDHIQQNETLDHAEQLLISTSSQRTRRASQLSSPDAGLSSARPTPASSVTAFQTPRKSRRTVVPSSETPSSIHLSWNEISNDDRFQRSPLKERSSNIQFAEQCHSGYPSPKGLRCHFDMKDFETNFPDAAEDGSQDTVWRAKLVFTPRKTERFADRALQRATTIQDSEDEDLNSVDISFDTEGISVGPDERQETLEPAKPRLSFGRTTTVQQSPIDSCTEELELEDDDSNAFLNGSATIATYDPMFQQTFDPVTTALERDAKRFGFNSTQFTTQFQNENTVSEEQKTGHSQDPSTARGGDVAEETQLVMCSQSAEHEPRHKSLELGNDFPENALPKSHAVCSTALGCSRSTTRSPSATRYVERTAKSREVEFEMANPLRPAICFESEENGYHDRIPSSVEPQVIPQDYAGGGMSPDLPPSMRDRRSLPLVGPMKQDAHLQRTPQSQISTVAPTQCSRLGSAHDQQTTSTLCGNTLSSSPFPLPPSDEADRVFSVMDTQATDFSLPPPPPFSSSPIHS